MSIDKDFGSVVGRCEACGGSDFNGHVCDDYLPAGFAQAAKAHLEAAELQRRKAEGWDKLEWTLRGSWQGQWMHYWEARVSIETMIQPLEAIEAAMRKEAGNG